MIGKIGKRVGYGWLYNWFAVDGGLAPDGWDVPTHTLWTDLANYLIAEYGHITSSNVGGALKSTRNEWLSPNTGATDEFGFSGLPGGYRDFGSFFDIKNVGYWWSSTEYEQDEARDRSVASAFGTLISGNYNKNEGKSVRCLQPRRPKYGRLYTWACAAHPNIAPTGWSVPTEFDYNTLTIYMFFEYSHGTDPFVTVGDFLKSKRQVNTPLGYPWNKDEHPRWDENSDFYGRDTVGFKALPCGELRTGSIEGTYHGMGTSLRMWLSEEASKTNGKNGIILDSGHIGGSSIKKYGMSIRCFRAATSEEELLDDGTSCGIVTDVDGNAYGTTKIGTQVWMRENLVVTKLNDGTPINNVESEDWKTGDIGDDDLAYNDPLDDGSYSVEQDGDTGTLSDIDGNTYKWVVIGNYRWMAENLRTTKYKNGDTIPEVTDGAAWAELTTGARCAYDNDHYYVYSPKR